jgi:hypothetical protein
MGRESRRFPARVNFAYTEVQGIAAGREGRQVRGLHCRSGCDCARGTGAGIGKLGSCGSVEAHSSQSAR